MDIAYITNCVENWIKNAFVKVTEGTFTKQIRELGLDDKKIKDILSKRADSIAHEILMSTEWDIDTIGKEISVSGTFELDPYDEDSLSQRGIISFTVVLPTWVDVIFDVKVDLQDDLTDIMGRSYREKIDILLKNSHIVSYMMSELTDRVQKRLQGKKFPFKELEDLTEIIEGDHTKMIFDIDIDPDAINEVWDLILTPSMINVAPNLSSIRATCRLTCEIDL